MHVSKIEYDRAFELEQQSSYPAIDALEKQYGIVVDRARLERAARVLACPVKVNPPCWQHGRIIYSVARDYIERSVKVDAASGKKRGPVTFLDIGTAKGFSALCARWAIEDAGIIAHSVSVDVIDPAAKVRRNTVAEVSGYCSLYDTIKPWSESRNIEFIQSTGVDYLTKQAFRRVDFAFVDGKHSYDVVMREAALLSHCQDKGDIVIFDDVQIAGVANAVFSLGTASGPYDIQLIEAKADRKYAIGTRR